MGRGQQPTSLAKTALLGQILVNAEMRVPKPLRDAASTIQSVERNHSSSPDILSSEEYEAIRPAEEAGYEHIGTGTDRVVFRLNESTVAKIARPKTDSFDGKQANRLERNQYQSAAPEVRRLLAPVKYLSEDATALLMERATEIRGYEHEIPDSFSTAAKEKGINDGDMLVWNVGYIPSKGRDCLIDYGNQIL